MGKDLVSQRESAKIFTENTDPLLAYPKPSLREQFECTKIKLKLVTMWSCCNLFKDLKFKICEKSHHVE